MFGKRAYCILGTMLLAFASLGAGVSAEDCNDQMADLEELGVLEISIDDHGVVEAVITQDAFLSFMNSDEEALLTIESIDVTVSLDENRNLLLSDFDLGVGEEQSDEVTVTLRLSEELLEILQDEDMHHLLVELGFGDDLGLDDFTPEVEEDYEDYYGSRIHWADEAYQLRGSQDDYDRVMDAEDPAEEFYAIYDEMMHDWEEDESEEDWNESEDEGWSEEDELEEEYHEAPEEDDDRGDRGSLEDLIEPRDGEIDQIIVIVNTDGEIAEVTIIVIYEDGDYEMNVYTMLLEEVRDRIADFDGVVIWNWVPAPPVDPVDDEDEGPDVLRERCARGLLRGTFTINDDGNGTMRGLIMDEDGNVIGNMWGSFDVDGFAHGFGGADNVTDAKWKAVYEDGRFSGLWKMIDENDSAHGMLKGHYEVNEDGDTGVFHGKWKEADCRADLEVDVRDTLPPVVDTEPRHSPLRVDAERVDDVRQLDKSPEAKPLMDKMGDLMDKPLVEDEEGGMVINVGDAAAGSTLGTIALLGAGFLRRRITGGL